MSKPTPIKAGDELADAWSYEFNSWEREMDGRPIALLLSEDNSEAYEMNRKHLFELKGKKFAVVKESGCSCYEAGDAEINVYPNYAVAKDAYDSN